jgi:hypothetical protein
LFTILSKVFWHVHQRPHSQHRRLEYSHRSINPSPQAQNANYPVDTRIIVTPRRLALSHKGHPRRFKTLRSVERIIGNGEDCGRDDHCGEDGTCVAANLLPLRGWTGVHILLTRAWLRRYEYMCSIENMRTAGSSDHTTHPSHVSVH